MVDNPGRIHVNLIDFPTLWDLGALCPSIYTFHNQWSASQADALDAQIQELKDLISRELEEVRSSCWRSRAAGQQGMGGSGRWPVVRKSWWSLRKISLVSPGVNRLLHMKVSWTWGYPKWMKGKWNQIGWVGGTPILGHLHMIWEKEIDRLVGNHRIIDISKWIDTSFQACSSWSWSNGPLCAIKDSMPGIEHLCQLKPLSASRPEWHNMAMHMVMLLQFVFNPSFGLLDSPVKTFSWHWKSEAAW